MNVYIVEKKRNKCYKQKRQREKVQSMVWGVKEISRQVSKDTTGETTAMKGPDG